MTEDVEPQGSCEVCFRRDPKPGEGVVCWPCRQRQWASLDEVERLLACEIPEEIMTPSGLPNFAAIDVGLAVPTIHARRIKDGVTDSLVPHIVTRRRVLTVSLESGEARQVMQVERELVRGPDGKPELVPAGDQTGHTPVLWWMDQWVRYWREMRAEAVAEKLPVPTPERLAGWLRARVDWAADNDPAFADFALELREHLRRLRNITGMQPQALPVPCPNPVCDMLTLVRWPYSDWDECRNPKCGQMVGPRRQPGEADPRPGEYDDLVTEAVEALEMQQGGAA